MKNLLTLFAVLFVLLAASCYSSKGITQEEPSEEIQRAYEEQGFLEGIVQTTRESSCAIKIKIEGENDPGYLLDPINFNDMVKSKPSVLWFKYRPLRMKNRCDDAQPVEITEIATLNK